jgi:hypothetical protein
MKIELSVQRDVAIEDWELPWVHQSQYTASLLQQTVVIVNFRVSGIEFPGNPQLVDDTFTDIRWFLTQAKMFHVIDDTLCERFVSQFAPIDVQSNSVRALKFSKRQNIINTGECPRFNCHRESDFYSDVTIANHFEQDVRAARTEDCRGQR